jgi:hypothetical protein
LAGLGAAGAASWVRGLAATGVSSAVWLGAPRVADAAGKVSIALEIDETEVAVGDVVTLRVEVTLVDDGSGLDVSMPILPASDALVISKRGSGVSRSMSWANGVSSSTTTASHTYVIEPLAPGRYELDVTVELGGESYHAESVPVLTVTGEAVVSPVRRDSRSKPSSSKSDVVVWPFVDRTRVYVGQPLVYELEIWERVDARISVEQLPTFEDFFARDLPQGRERIDRIGTVPYRVHPLVRRLLVPQRAGRLAVGAPSVSIDDADPFLLLRRRKRGGPKRAKGDAVEVEVLPLPAEGQPASFPSGNVGVFTLVASVDKTALAVGEALTLTLVTEGSGDLSLGTPPPLPSVDGLRFYEPKHTIAQDVKEGDLVGTRTTTVLVLTRRPGELEIPAIELPYFDPIAGAYRVAKSQALKLEVTGDGDAIRELDDAASARATDEGGASEGTLAALLATRPVSWQPRRRASLGVGEVLMGAGAIATLSMALFGGAALALTLRESDEQRAARKAARATQARRRLVRDAARAGRVEHDALASLLHERARARLGPSAEGQTRARLAAALRTAGVTDALVVRWSSLLERCDAARFTGAAQEAAAAKQLVDEALEILDDVGWGGSTPAGAAPRSRGRPASASRTDTRGRGS